MAEHPNKFAELFKKYRLKAEIPTLSQFGHLLAEKGFNYEDSIFSHWQNGTRIPQYRSILIKLLEIFNERGALTNVDQANEFLASAGQGYLSEEELQKISLKQNSQIFQVPNRITNFTGRGDVINRLVNEENIPGKVVVIHGPAGVGKTALAIELGHLLKDKFKDGVLWYKVEEDNTRDILFSIAKVLGEDIGGISDLQVRGTVARSLLASKNILLFLDSAELSDKINLLIPNTIFGTTIITSQKSQLKTPIDLLDINLKAFTEQESLSLFKEVLKEKYSKISKSNLLKIAAKVGNLPLALHLIAGDLMQRNLDVKELLDKELQHEGNSLDSAIAVSYEKLDSKNKSVLLSASIFKGKDFSAKSIGYINGLSVTATLTVLESLINLSLLENSTKNRYRIHPAIKEFVRDKLNYPRSSYLSMIATVIFGFFGVWWIILHLFVDKENIVYPIFASTYFVMALYGGICGISTSFNWGGLRTLLGRAIFMFSVGLFGQVFGQLAYSYNTNILKTGVYPSLGDVGYFGTIPFYIYGVFLLAESSGIRINFQLFRKRLIAIVVPVIMVFLAYVLFLQDYIFDFRDPIKMFLDFGYPLGGAIYISIVIIIFILSRTILDGIMRSKALLLLIALLIQFITDYLFVYDGDANYYSGNYIDFLCLLAYFTMTIALLGLRSLNINIKEKL